MKQIELRTVKIELPGGQEITLDYKAQLAATMQNPLDPRAGADIHEIRKSIKVLDALESANGVLKLEDADYDFLKTKVNAMRFNFAHRAFIEFVDAINNALPPKIDAPTE